MKHTIVRLSPIGQPAGESEPLRTADAAGQSLRVDDTD